MSPRGGQRERPLAAPGMRAPGTCLTALSHEGLQAHTRVVINQVNTVPSIQAGAGLTLVHLCNTGQGGLVGHTVDLQPRGSRNKVGWG